MREMNYIVAGEIFPEWYWTPIFFVMIFGLPIIVVTVIVFFIYRKVLSNKGSTLNTKSLIIKIFLVVAGIFIIGNLLYSFYINNRSGSLNPYTEECIKYGYEGAKGKSCTGNYDSAKDPNQSPENPYKLD